MIIATAGHIDHGKTALVAALTGVDTDRLAEEKRRGMSIDLGFAYHPLASGAVIGFVDVPGHERFVRTMLAGVAGVDFALLAVAADDGVMPQTNEHIDILALLGIARGAVAITKADLAGPERIAEVGAQLAARLAGTPLAGAPVFAVSAREGTGIDALAGHIEDVAGALAARPVRGAFRLAIDRAFTLAGAGLVVTGTVYSGACAIGDRLIVSPAGAEARVRALHVNSREAGTAAAGARAAVNIAGPAISKDAVRRGDWLVAPPAHAPTSRLDARLTVAAGEDRVLANWTPVHLHIGADDVPARVAVLEGASIAPGSSGLVRLALDRPVGALAHDRFILRDQSARRTIAGGTVIDPFPPPRGRARPQRLAQLAALEPRDDGAALAGLLAASPAGVDLGRFAVARNLSAGEAEAVYAGAAMVRRGESAIAPAHEAALKERIIAALGAFHEARPDRLGPDRATVRRTIGGAIAPALVTGATDDLVEGGAVLARGTLVHLADHAPRLAPGDEAVWAAVAQVLESAGSAPPVVHEIAKTTGTGPDAVASTLRRAEAIGLVVRVGRNRFAPPDVVEQLAATARGLAEAGELTPVRFRQEAGIGRNLAVEYLEHFDRVGMTRRDGDRRYLL